MPTGLLSSRQACARLGVKPSTLYTYVSRGWIRSVLGERKRERLYVADDVERVAAKAEARRGHRAVAAGALRFGDPVLDTAITSAGPVHLLYRGQDAVALAKAETPFEDVASLLWGTDLGDRPWPWPKASLLSRQRRDEPVLWRLASLIPRLAADDTERTRHGWGQEPERAARLIRALAASVGRSGARDRPATIAQTLSSRLGLETRAEPALSSALCLLADHELNVSTFAARVAASGGADLYACIGAALYAFSGPRHGYAPQQIADFIDQVGTPRRARLAVRDRLDRGQTIPGFEPHPVYPGGDPRAAPLLEWAERLTERSRPRLRTLLAVHEAVVGFGPHAMTVDAGLLAFALAVGLDAEEASTIFCIGRTAGWVAHVFEQRATKALLRPRARYTGLPPAVEGSL